MKNITHKIIFAFILALTYQITFGQSARSYDIPLSDPGADGKLVVHIIEGNISVAGHSGKNVIVEVDGKRFNRPGNDQKDGLKRIENNSLGFTIEELNNVVYVKHQPGWGIISYSIKVPTNFSVDLKTVNGKHIDVKNVSGSHEVSAINGSITMDQVSGSVIADALNNDIVVTFDAVDPSNTMMFSSLNGDVDVSFPSSLKADIHASSDWGNVYSDFEIAASKDPKQVHITDNKELYKVSSGNGVIGQINGGGSLITFKSMNGDILIRSGK